MSLGFVNDVGSFRQITGLGYMGLMVEFELVSLVFKLSFLQDSSRLRRLTRCLAWLGVF